ncbi:MAG: hypothetical protein H0U85_05145, partial [Gemmatimonadales bacterium]|nr:hypothetical protein [Gemmatimonadales bacterium]
MVARLLAALVLQSPAAPAPQQPDTLLSFSNAATRVLVTRAIARHRGQDSAVVDYSARLRYRLTAAVGRRRWGRFPVGTVEEQEATVAWHLPNDLRVDIVGRRAASRNGAPPLSSVFDRPWFVPRSVGDSVRIISNEFPATGALHPLAGDGPAFYHYDLTDSVTATIAGGRRIRLFAVQYTPKRAAPALVVGRLWLDAASAEVVRFTFRYVGSELFARPGEEGRDSAATRRLNRIASSIISIDADLEYGLQDGRYWMPYRQVIGGQVRVPLSEIVVPFQAVTTFQDYEINTGRTVAFSLPDADSVNSDSTRAARLARRDSVRAARQSQDEAARDTVSWARAGRWSGGRYEVHRPSNDSLRKYHGWTDSLQFELPGADDQRFRSAQADLARLSEELPDEITLRKAHGFAYQNLGDAIQFNRVQGVSLGAGYRTRLPGTDFADLFATLRYGFSDRRVTGRLSMVRDAPSGRVTVGGYHDVLDVDPFSPGKTFFNSFNALVTAHDDADYYLATGGVASLETAVGTGLDVVLTVRGERQRSVTQRARAGVNDLLGGTGDFAPNAPVDEGTYALGGVRLNGYGPMRWSLAAEGMAGTESRRSARVFGQAQRSFGGTRGATLRLKAGVAASPVEQYLFRLGGLNTLRGFGYGAERGEAFWSGQLDVSPLQSNIRPVLFIDAGHASAARDLFSDALVGGGVGVSVYSPLLRSTLFRLDLSHPISPGTGGKWRF